MLEQFPGVENNTPQQEKISQNPNSIGEVIGIGDKDIPTFPDKVYRSVIGEAAIDDLFESGVVRNAFSAKAVKHSRWGDRVFWSKGVEGKYHNVQKDGSVIEALFEVASRRPVTKEDITAIYQKTAEGEITNVLPERQQKELLQERQNESQKVEKRQADLDRIAEIKRELGLPDRNQNF